MNKIKKKVLYLSGINNTKKYGFFVAVSNRIKLLKQNKHIYFFSIPFVDSLFVRIIKSLFNIKTNDFPKNDTFLKYIPLKKGLLGYIRSFFDKDYFDKKLFNLVEKIVLEKNINFIHVHWAYPYGYIVSEISKKYNIPYVLNIHGSDIYVHPFRNKNIMDKTIKALNGAKEVYCVSKGIANQAKAFGGVINKNFNITYNGIFLPNTEYANIEKKQHICFIGSLEKVKGADRLIDIFKEITINIPNIELTIIGQGSYYKSIKDSIIKNKLNINLLGYIEYEKIKNIITKCDLVIIPSRSEGFSLVVLESYAYNIPVVATDCGGMSDLVLDKELLIKDDNNYIKNISDAIVKYYTNDYEKYKSKRERKEYIEYVKKYSWDEIVKEESKHYK